MSKLQPLSSQPQTGVQMLPTPVEGWPLQYWQDDLMSDKPMAAVCVQVLGPGRIKVAIMEPDRVLRYKTGVNWAGDDRRLQHDRPYRLNGVWDFLPDLRPRNATKLHKEAIEAYEKAKREENARQQELLARREREHEARKTVISQETA